MYEAGKAVLAGSQEAGMWPAHGELRRFLSADRFGVHPGFGRCLS